MRRPATVTVTPRPPRRDVADPPRGHYGQSFQTSIEVLGALWLSCRSEAACARVY